VLSRVSWENLFNKLRLVRVWTTASLNQLHGGER